MQHRKTKIIRKPLHLLKAVTLKVLRYIMTALLAIVALIVLAAGAMLLFLVISEYRPGTIEVIPVPARLPNASTPHDSTSSRIHEFTILSWNIGYAGLGRDEDFFFDGGKMVQPSEERSAVNLEGIVRVMKSHDTADFIFMQEIDRDSKRSFHTDQVARLSEQMPAYIPVYAMNYNCRFIPVFPWNPIGKVESGILSLSRHDVASATRHQYKVNFPWPKRLVFLKRCFVAERILLENGKELVMVNLHNSAFDSSGRLRKAELKQLQGFLESEYAKGNYVVAGGDWNSNPRGFSAATIRTGDKSHDAPPPIEDDFIPGWTFAFDPSVPSNRDVDMAYKRGKTGTTVIDFFVLSPNLEVKSVKTLDLGFEYSDHNPVLLTFALH
jgi:endonuclease/exonuclease/phosphatase family metal-dependent hydrolase